MKFGISDKGFRRLAQGSTAPTELYHVTYSGNLESIAQNGLQAAYGEGIGGASYETHKQKGVFLTSESGVNFWFGKSEDWSEHRSDNPYEDELTPVVLQVEVPDPSKLLPDEIGSADSLAEAWIYPDSIPPENIWVWDAAGEEPGWYEIESILDEPLDTSIAYDVEEEEDEETGESIDLYYHKQDRPFFPKFSRRILARPPESLYHTTSAGVE